MNKRWKLWAQHAYPLSEADKAAMIRDCDNAVLAVNPGMTKVKSPAAQFDESHRIWVENGRQ